MTPGPLDEKVVAERSEWVRDMLEAIRELPLDSVEDFTAERRNVAAAESSLRRALEALLDLGRHVLAKGFGDAPAEYKEVAKRLGERGVLTAAEAGGPGRCFGTPSVPGHGTMVALGLLTAAGAARRRARDRVPRTGAATPPATGSYRRTRNGGDGGRSACGVT